MYNVLQPEKFTIRKTLDIPRGGIIFSSYTTSFMKWEKQIAIKLFRQSKQMKN